MRDIDILAGSDEFQLRRYLSEPEEDHDPGDPWGQARDPDDVWYDPDDLWYDPADPWMEEAPC